MAIAGELGSFPAARTVFGANATRQSLPPFAHRPIGTDASFQAHLFEGDPAATVKKTVSPQIWAALKDASARTGVDFTYLLEKATVESSLRPDAEAKTSSATGLFQFIETTWLNVVKEHGPAYGLHNEAAAITRSEDGTPQVADPRMRAHILSLRKDPYLSSVMVGEFTRDNHAFLEKTVGGDIGSTELYLAHFLGAQGASKFIGALRDNPHQSAETLFPQAARANLTVFYHKGGEAKTLAEIYRYFEGKLGGESIGDLVAERGAGRGSSFVPEGLGGLDPYQGSLISRYSAMALAALEVPQEQRNAGQTPYGSQRSDGAERAAHQALNEFQRDWNPNNL